MSVNTINLRIAGEGDVTGEKRTKAFFFFTSGRGIEHDASRWACIGIYFLLHGSVAVTGSVIGRKLAGTVPVPIRLVQAAAHGSSDLYTDVLRSLE